MKKPCNAIENVCRCIFGYGMLIALLVGGLTFIGYVIALVIGGQAAAAICSVIFKSIVPFVTYLTTVSIVFGLGIMYFTGEKNLSIDSEKSTQAIDKHKF